MTIFLMVYIAEIIVFSLVWIIGSILFLKKRRSGLFMFLTLSIAAFIVAIAVTFVLEKPTMNLQEIENIEAKTEVKINAPKTIYHFRDITDKVKIIQNVDLDTLGEYEVQFEVNTLLGKYIKKDIVKVVDTTPPEINLEGGEEYKESYSKDFIDPGFTAIDTYDGDLTQSVETRKEEINEEEFNIRYKVQDSSGNTAEKIRHVTLIDDTPPKITLNGAIYLTFDDGPTTSSTPKILDILKNKGVKATFFIINYDSAGEQLVKREYAEGHTIAIHGYSHTYSEIYQSVDAYMNNITKLQDKINRSTGFNSTITRFPGGSSNTVSKKYCPGIMTQLCKLLVSKGYSYFDWNVDSNDAGNAKSADDVYRNVTKGLSKSKSNVVLMHDFSGNTKTINALERIIDYGLSNGYTFKAITKDTPMVTHTPNN